MVGVSLRRALLIAKLKQATVPADAVLADPDLVRFAWERGGKGEKQASGSGHATVVQAQRSAHVLKVCMLQCPFVFSTLRDWVPR